MLRTLLLGLAAAASAKHHGEDIANWVRNTHVGERNAVVGNAQRAVAAAIASLLAYYEGDEQVLDAVTASTPGLARNLEAKLASRAVSGEGARFVVAALGSSVTAGHDNVGSTAWPAVLERRLKGALGPLGIDVEVRNQAVGGREPFPASLCLAPIAGEDADLVVREWEYWSFGDGLQGEGLRKGGESGDVEVFLRNALGLPGAPSVFFLNLDADGAGQKTKALGNMFAAGPMYKAYGPNHGVAVLSAFGKTFDHLRAKAPKKRLDRSGKKECSGRNVGDCPVGEGKPDGHHTRPLHIGIPEDDPLVPFADPAKLFINWHPGTLGHEVMGHQVAYAVLKALQRGLNALGKVASSGEAAPPWTFAGPAPLPPAAACAGSALCGAHPPLCAMSTLPKAQTPDLGDWVRNGTALGPTKWSNRPTQEANNVAVACAAPSKECRNSPGSNGCWGHTRKCSYADMKRAFSGTAADGALVLGFPARPSNGASCSLSLSEPGYAWSKPKTYANWHMELKVTVDGEPCRACRVDQGQGQYLQNYHIDVKKHLELAGSNKRCEDVDVAVSVDPIDGLEAWEAATGKKVCQLARNGNCEAKEDWRRYAIGCDKTGDKADPCKLGKNPGRDPKAVAAFITSAIAW